MGRLSETDLRGILRFLDAAAPGDPADPLPRPTLSALSEVIPADLVEYFELRRSDRAYLAYATDRDLDAAPGTDEAIARFGHQNPLRWRRWTPADGPLRLSKVIGRRQLQRLEWYDTFLRPNRIRDTLKIWLHSSPYSAACVSLERFHADFSRRDADVLGVLQQHLAAIRERGLAGQPETNYHQVQLTPREAEVLSWIARGKRIDEIGQLLFMSAATVRKHLENAYDKLGVHSRVEALARLMLTGPLL